MSWRRGRRRRGRRLQGGRESHLAAGKRAHCWRAAAAAHSLRRPARARATAPPCSHLVLDHLPDDPAGGGKERRVVGAGMGGGGGFRRRRPRGTRVSTRKRLAARRQQPQPRRRRAAPGAAPGHLVAIQVDHGVGHLDLARGGDAVGLACGRGRGVGAGAQILPARPGAPHPARRPGRLVSAPEPRPRRPRGRWRPGRAARAPEGLRSPPPGAPPPPLLEVMAAVRVRRAGGAGVAGGGRGRARGAARGARRQPWRGDSTRIAERMAEECMCRRRARGSGERGSARGFLAVGSFRGERSTRRQPKRAGDSAPHATPRAATQRLPRGGGCDGDGNGGRRARARAATGPGRGRRAPAVRAADALAASGDSGACFDKGFAGAPPVAVGPRGAGQAGGAQAVRTLLRRHGGALDRGAAARASPTRQLLLARSLYAAYGRCAPPPCACAAGQDRVLRVPRPAPSRAAGAASRRDPSGGRSVDSASLSRRTPAVSPAKSPRVQPARRQDGRGRRGRSGAAHGGGRERHREPPGARRGRARRRRRRGGVRAARGAVRRSAARGPPTAPASPAVCCRSRRGRRGRVRVWSWRSAAATGRTASP
jgi:hypothetical protein